MRRVLVLSPGFDHSDGGIQAYSQELLHALHEDFSVVSLAGAGKPRSAFVIEAIRAALFQNPSVIISTHLHYSPVAWLAARLCEAPYLVSLHGIEAWHVKGGLRRAAIMRASTFLPVSNFTKERFEKSLGASAGKSRILHNTFDSSRFSPAPKPPYLLARYNLASTSPVIMTVGRLDPGERYKGHDQILTVLPELRREFPDIRYIVVGAGEDLERLKILAHEKGVLSSTTFAGRVSEAELADHYRLCDAFIMPSSGEGFGIAYLEALGCGRRIVTGLDAGQEIIDSPDLGIAVDPSDEKALLSATTTLLKSPGDASEIHRKVRARFGRASFKKSLLEILSERSR